MRLDLRELIVNPERRLPFHAELETGNLDFPSVRGYLHPPIADGIVTNEAGVHPELFVLEGTEIDVQEVLSTCFILDMETKFLCREDCKGLCARCGRNLNLGPCGCGKEIDPRFAVLEQLLDKSL